MTTSAPTTLKALKAALAPRGIRVQKTEDGEYRLSLKKAQDARIGEAQAYYTNALSDAYQTGLSMALWSEDQAPKTLLQTHSDVAAVAIIEVLTAALELGK